MTRSKKCKNREKYHVKLSKPSISREKRKMIMQTEWKDCWILDKHAIWIVCCSVYRTLTQSGKSSAKKITGTMWITIVKMERKVDLSLGLSKYFIIFGIKTVNSSTLVSLNRQSHRSTHAIKVIPSKRSWTFSVCSCQRWMVTLSTPLSKNAMRAIIHIFRDATNVGKER